MHHADEFGLRRSRAAGVRQRMSNQSRETLEQVFTFSGMPLGWISRLPDPHDARTALQAIKNLHPVERLPTLTLPADTPDKTIQRLETISKRGSWTVDERSEIITNFGHGARISGHGFDTLLNTWRSLAVWGERYLEALQEYQEAFFAEEEIRIRPALEVGLVQAQVSAQKMPLAKLVEELSRGVLLESPETLKSFTLLPSWWVAPLAFLVYPEPGKALMAFDIRSGSKSGGAAAEAPEVLVTALKALGDPTRLRILKYLAVEPLAPSELARRLRLRPPTVIHHLRLLRFAGLVQVTVSEKLEKRYAARLEELQIISNVLKDYLSFNG
jgi:DNA-binding transcriptional ArsR family regulator